MSQSADRREEAKALFSVLLEGHSVALIDNVERPLSSPELSAILTEPNYSSRLLGANRTATVPTNITWLVTGNNIRIVGDLTSRVVVSRIDPRSEFPEQRRFRLNLHKEVPRRRPQLVAAILTIIRAYLAAGSPPQPLPHLGRFEDWQDWIRFPLVWLGMDDPLETQQRIAARDPVREKLTPLLQAWNEMFGDLADITVNEAIARARDSTLLLGDPHDARARLLDAMLAIAGDGRDHVNPERLGNFIRNHEGRIETRLCFRRGISRQGRATWKAGPQ